MLSNSYEHQIIVFKLFDDLSGPNKTRVSASLEALIKAFSLLSIKASRLAKMPGLFGPKRPLNNKITILFDVRICLKAIF